MKNLVKFSALTMALLAGLKSQAAGGVDLDAYCKNHLGDQAVAVRVADDAYGWRCYSRRTGYVNINMQKVCFEETGFPSAWFSNYQDSKSWECGY